MYGEVLRGMRAGVEDGFRIVRDDAGHILLRQRIWKEADMYREVDPDLIDPSDWGARERPKLGHWYLSVASCKPARWGGSYWIQKKEMSGEKILIVLPCNSGGTRGNYFKGGIGGNPWNLWRAVDLEYRDMRDQFYVAAVDCGVVVHKTNKDGLGALQFEDEMERALIPEDPGIPGLDRFWFREEERSRRAHISIWDFIEGLEVALERMVARGFKHIYALLSPHAYRLGFCVAVQRKKMWDRVTVIDTPTMGGTLVGIKLLRALFLEGHMQRGILDPLFLRFRDRPPVLYTVPEELQFWKFGVYQDWRPTYVKYLLRGFGPAGLYVAQEHARKPDREVFHLYNASPGSEVVEKRTMYLPTKNREWQEQLKG